MYYSKQKMVQYGCPRCNFKTKDKSIIKRHYNRKIPCKAIIGNISIDECKIMLENKALIISTEEEKLKNEISETVKILQEQVNNQQNQIDMLIKKQKQNQKIENTQFIYILKEREFVKSDKEIYKLGKTRSLTNRMGDYPKGSKIKLVYPCNNDIDNVEKELIKRFDEQFEHQCDIGREYYKGDLDSMIQIVTSFINSKNL
jgi:hypothetical protein